MVDRERFRPFTGDVQRQIRLKSAPLALVLCQIRWPELTQFQGDLKQLAVEFGSRLEEYPVYGEVQEMGYAITSEGVQPTHGSTVYQWHSIDGAWHVTFGRRFASLYCTEYESFDALSTRLEQVIELIGSVLRVPLVERLGVRYVNRIDDPALIEDLDQYVTTSVLGFSALTPHSNDATLVSGVNQARFHVGGSVLQVRSGLTSPGETVDPSIAPLDRASWVMDLDAATEGLTPFDSDALKQEVGRLADIAYDFFKLVATDGFVREFGGSE